MARTAFHRDRRPRRAVIALYRLPRERAVHAVNTSTNAGTSIATGAIGVEPDSMAVTPEGTKVVVAEGASSQVQIITAPATHSKRCTSPATLLTMFR
jgi:DNA-binding beta-propeller fold protein YncE